MARPVTGRPGVTVTLTASVTADAYFLTDKPVVGNRAKSPIESDGGLKASGHDRDRTCDPYHVKVVRNTNSFVKSNRKGK